MLIIVRLWGGTGNQLFQYATGLRFALKWNTELKVDKINLDTDNNGYTFYTLDNFNITATPATPEEIAPLREICFRTGLGMQRKCSLETILQQPRDIYLHGDWCNEVYFPGIRDVLLKQLTFKNPLSSVAEEWKQKILSAECAVSMHFRHGDFLYQPDSTTKPWFHVPPLDYYYNCIKLLKQQYKNLTVFVFSNNMAWVKDNLHLDVPTEFVEGWNDKKRFNVFLARDIEEMYLMSICKHNINPRSAFSWWGAYLNQNPDKKVFVSLSSTAEAVKKYQYSLATNNNSPLESGRWINVPFDRDKQPDVTMPPIFSLLLVVNNDAANLSATLDSLLSQNYKYYEVVIIDNASTDGSDKVCQQAIEGSEKVTYKRLAEKVNHSTAWNEALKLAQGRYVSFLKVGDQFLPTSFSSLYYVARRMEIIYMFSYLKEDDGGTVTFCNKKYSAQRDTKFKDEKRGSIVSKDGADAAKLLLNHEINSFLGTKLYNVEFLTEQEIKFDETLDNEAAEIAFQKETFLKSKHFMYLSNAFYVAPKA